MIRRYLSLYRSCFQDFFLLSPDIKNLPCVSANQIVQREGFDCIETIFTRGSFFADPHIHWGLSLSAP